MSARLEGGNARVNSFQGETIDKRYRLLEFVSAGTFGEVWRAEQIILGQGNAGLVAVKILHEGTGDEKALMREVQGLRKCLHPNVIGVHAAGKNHFDRLGGRFFIAMELADESLADHLQLRGRLTPDQMRPIAFDVCSGLAHLHRSNLVHRDLKKANVLLVNGTWKLSDFGTLRECGFVTPSSRMAESRAWLPPEGTGDRAGTGFDMWSLGCLVHECLTGRSPVADLSTHRLDIDPSIPEPFSSIVNGCLRQDPTRRWSAEQCLGVLHPQATPLHPGPGLDLDICFLCSAGNDCARHELRGVLHDIRATADGFACTLYTADELEAVPLLLTETWADQLGTRLVEAWPRLREREHAVTLSAFHVMAHGKGFRATDASLVVLDRDWLCNVTALSSVHGCERARLVRRYQGNETSMPLIVGRVVNDLFPDIWNHGETNETRQEREIGTQVRNIARLSNVSLSALRGTVNAHVRRLTDWATSKTRTSKLHTETYVISPPMGLKGRIDALWFRDSEPVVLAELKTGGRYETDELQLTSYGLMLVSRKETPWDIPSLLLHSKPELDRVQTQVRLDRERFRKAVVMRNKVLLVDCATDAPFNEAYCHRCFRRDQKTCALLAHLGGHDDTRSEGARRRFVDSVTEIATLGPAERAFFRRYEGEVLEELRAAKSQHAWLWSRTSEERAREGLAMRFEQQTLLDTRGSGHRYALHAGDNANHSLFKPDDRVILSGPDGPTRGRLATALVTGTSADGIEVSCDEPLPFESGWVNVDSDENLVEREFASLFGFIIRPTPLRGVIISDATPRLGPLPTPWSLPRGLRLNDLQAKAVEQSVRTEDYLLVLGPPGAGKTTLLRAIIEAHLALGKRVLVSAQTNRAVDQVCRKLLEGGLQSKMLRLGRYAAVSQDIQPCTLEALYDSHDTVEKQVEAIRHACAHRPIVATTASALAKGEIDGLTDGFDLVIVDEATQLSVPMSLGPLRYGKRFVLVGDPKQLAPIRLVRDAPFGLGRRDESLFEMLERRIRAAQAEGLVELEHQYRMNEAICAVPSEMWYRSTLQPGTREVAQARLDVNVRGLDDDVSRILDPHRPLVFIDVPPDFSHGPRMNLTEARWAARVAAALYGADTRLADPDEAERRLGVLAPFRSQVACIRRELGQQLPQVPESRRWVDTVDRFQGDERDIMIISLVGGRDGRLPELIQEPRRLNVALSRARHKLVLIGNHALLCGDDMFRRLFDVMERAVPDYLVRP